MLKRNLWIAGLLLCVVFSALIFSLAQGYRSEQSKLLEKLDRQSQLQTLTGLLVKELGYTGMIHQFKNYLLRGDEQYYAATRHSIERVERFLFESRRINVNPALELEYQRVAETVAKYKLALDSVRKLHASGEPVIQIDKEVRIDDTEAALGQRGIINYLQSELTQSLLDMQNYNKRILQYLAGLILSAVFLTIVVSVLLYYYFNSARRSEGLISEITARQRLLDAAPNPMLVVAETGEIMFANDGAAALFEVGKSELMHSTLESWIPAPVKYQHERLRQLFFSSRGERTMLNPVSLTTRSGRVVEVEVCIGLFEMDAAAYAVANITDVTKITAYRARLDQAEKKYRTTFEVAPVGITHVGLDMKFIEVNPYFAQMLGYTPDELLDKTIIDVTAEDDVGNSKNLLSRLLSENVDMHRFEKRYLHRDGRIVWGNLVVTLSRDIAGAPQFMIGVVENITQRKTFEQHLLASEKKFKTIAHYVKGVVWMATPGVTRMLFVNESYERIWMRSRESLYSHPRSYIDAVVPEERGRVMEELKRHAEGVWDIRYRIERPDGTIRHIHDEGTAVRDEKGDILYLVGLARDVTDEQLVRERLETTNQQLERLARFDPLTMAMRRQYCTPDLEDCIALFRRYETDATLIFIDLDEFKSINDRFGHETGDEVLIEFSRIVRSFIRETDGFYRYAGDEFLILLRETSLGEADKVVDKMIRRLPSVRVGLGHVVDIRFSCGLVALSERKIDSVRDWIRLADEKMYETKRQRKGSGYEGKVT